MPFGAVADDPVEVAQPVVDPSPGADVVALAVAVERALLVVPSVLSPRAAVVRAEALLALQERVGGGGPVCGR